eukprot:415944-Amorphochlora_amoeboformis.AAC.1
MGHMISTKKKEDQKGFRPRRMYLPDIPVGLVMERKADEVEPFGDVSCTDFCGEEKWNQKWA